MTLIFCIIFGIISGLFGGMGMGGGTFLIPLLTIFLSFEQVIAQGINLISFSLMAFIALIIHIKNKLIVKEVILAVVIPALIFSIVGSLLANLIDANVVKVGFGVFLCCLSAFEFYKYFEKN